MDGPVRPAAAGLPGLLIDAVERVWPVAGNRVDIICARERVKSG
ncbi:MAG: hypothetical protein R3B08_10260 [Nitrospira sp.]